MVIAMVILLALARDSLGQVEEKKTILYEEFPEIDYVFAVPKPVVTATTDTSAGDTTQDAAEEGQQLTAEEQIALLLGLEQEEKELTLKQQLQIVEDQSRIKPSQSQYIDILRNLQKKTEVAELDTFLRMHPDILQVVVDDYRYEYLPPFTSMWNRGIDFRMEVLMDPCRNRKFDCCWDRFGTPEYYNFRSGRVFYRDNTLIREDNRRFPPDYQYYTNPERPELGICKTNTTSGKIDRHSTILKPGGLSLKSVVYDDETCMADYMGRMLSPVFPACWDYNDTVESVGLVTNEYAVPLNCTDGYGVSRRHCYTVGYTQNAWIMECSGEYANDPKCGTWLEVHIPNDERIVSERKLPGGMLDGYRVIDLPLTYKGAADRVICAGDYEVWWVQRTPSKKIVHYQKPFRVRHPPCDYNRILDKYTRFFDLDYVRKNSLDGESVSLEDLLDISTTN